MSATRWRARPWSVAAAASVLAACSNNHHTASPPAAATSSQGAAHEPTATQPPAGLVEAFPNVRVDRAARVVEFDGIVPIEAHDPDAPHVFLEVIVCTPDSKEHESLVMTRAKAQHVHAALLLIGLEPGTTGSWEVKGTPPQLAPVDPTGPRVAVEFAMRGTDGREVVADPRDWVVDIKTGKRLGEEPAAGGPVWVFAGSRFVNFEGRQVYDADGVGTLVGLCTFGSETVAWGRTVSPDSQVQEPEWIANPKTVPAAGTSVVVRLRPAPN